MIRTVTACSRPAFQSPVAPQPQKRQERDADHGRHEHARHLVHERLDRRPRRLRLADRVHDAGVGGGGADARRPHAKRTGAVDGRAVHGVARLLLHRQALAGEHRLVQGRTAGDDLPVGRQPLARPHHADVADPHVGRRQLQLLAVALEARRLRRELQELAQGPPCALLRARLEPAPDEHQRHDHRRRLEPERRSLAAHQQDRRPDERGPRAHRDERVHVGRAVAQQAQGAGRETAPAPDDGDGARRECEPRHPTHRPRHGDDAEADGEDRVPRERATPVVALVAALREDEAGHVGDRGRVEPLQVDDERRLLGGEVDVGLRDALDVDQRLLQAGDARGAVHAPDLVDRALLGQSHAFPEVTTQKMYPA